MSRALRPPRAVTVCDEIRLARARVCSKHRPLYDGTNFMDYYRPSLLGYVVETQPTHFRTPEAAIAAGRRVQEKLRADLDNTWKNWRTAKVRKDTQDKDLHLDPVWLGGAR